MANEADIIYKLGNGGDPVEFDVSVTGNISGNALVVVSDEMTVATSGNTTNQRFCGIAASEKQNGDGATKIAVFTNVVADLVSVATAGAEGAIQVGDYVELSGINTVRRLSGNMTFDTWATVVGVSLATASGGERISVRVRK